VREKKKQEYCRRDGYGTVGHSLVFCAWAVFDLFLSFVSRFYLLMSFVRLAAKRLQLCAVRDLIALHYQIIANVT
jgi:hypothetical protein